MSDSPPTWHADEQLLGRYVVGRLDAATAASIEAHVIGCTVCRRALAAHVASPRLAAVWSDVVESIDDPRRGFIERFLRRLGVSESDARLASSAPALRLAWLVALVAVLVFCVTASGSANVGPNLFLLLAPALPTLGVGLAYGPWTDPTYELGQSLPYSAIRLLYLRTAVVLAVIMVVIGVTGVVLPGPDTAVLWLLPSAALVTSALALCAWMPALWAAATTGASWLFGVGSFWYAEGSLEPVFGTVGQLAALGLSVLACLVVLGGRHVHPSAAWRL